MRTAFEHELEQLEADMLQMGATVEKALSDSMDAIFSHDDALADAVIDGDDIVDQADFDVEKKCMRLLALQQPLARDLRLVGSTLKIVTDLERIGDNAVDIAKTAKRLNALPLMKPYQHLPKMIDLVKSMLHDMLEAFAAKDVDAARAIGARDAEVDSLYGFILNETYALMEANHLVIRQGIGIVAVVRYLERTADHVTNIGERIVYIQTGDWEDLNG